jgi:hypothetical protein
MPRLGSCSPSKIDTTLAIAAFAKAMTLNSNYVDWRFGIALIRAGGLKTGNRGCARPYAA